MTIPEQLKEKWMDEANDVAVYSDECGEGVPKKEIAAWWLSRFAEVLSEIEGKIEKEKKGINNTCGNVLCDSFYSQGIQKAVDIIKSFKNEERENENSI